MNTAKNLATRVESEKAQHSELVSCEQLRIWLGYETDGYVERFLESQNIRTFPGKGGKPCVLMDSLRKAAGLEIGRPTQPSIDANDVI